MLTNLTEHNSKLVNLDQMKGKCRQIYRDDNTAFSTICNISSEYPCLRNDVNDPLNLTSYRPCINLTQNGDGKVNCLTGLDERNRLRCGRTIGMLGFDYPREDSCCSPYSLLCDPSLSEMPTDTTMCFHQRRSFKNGTLSPCTSLRDVMCLNDTCIRNARCNGKIECLDGEDEYRCIHPSRSSQIYRAGKTNNHMTLSTFLKEYPIGRRTEVTTSPTPVDESLFQAKVKVIKEPVARVYDKRDVLAESVYQIVDRSLPNGMITFEKDYLPFVCNQDVTVQYHTGHTVCLCPPSFYGSQCEFFSDRITISTHLDLTNYPWLSHQRMAIIKVLVTFLFNEQTLVDHTEFHVNPLTENGNSYMKFMGTLVYRRSGFAYQLKRFTRPNTHLYSVRFEAFHLYPNNRIEPIGV